MSRFQRGMSAFLTVSLLFFGVISQVNAQQDRVNDREVADTMRQLDGKIDDFNENLNNDINRGNVNDNDEKQITDYFKGLKKDIDDFRQKFSDKNDSSDDVTKILNSGKNVNDNVSRLRLNAKTLNAWKAVRNLLDKLSLSYNISWSWKDGVWQAPNQNQASNQNSSADADSTGLTGTYKLDPSRSENVKDIASQAMNKSNAQNRDESRQDLEDRLESPDQLTIDLRGNQVTVASTIAEQVSFQTDGSVRTQTLSDGTSISIKATLKGEELTVSNVGGSNDYTVIFTPIDNGKSLKVTRRVTTDYLSQTVFAESVYTKTDAVARFDIYGNPNNSSTNTAGNSSPNDPTNNGNNNPTNANGNNPQKTTGNAPPAVSQGRTGQFIVPNGTIVTGLLDNFVSTKISQNNDRFKMRVQGPTQFKGAVIEGYLSNVNRSGKVTGRASLTLNFETITLQNGQKYDFAGYMQSMTDPQGKTVNVDSEGNARGGNQSKTTAIRSGIGAGLGALIGVIAGGGQGAAIGAIIGGGAGAGSVIAQGKDDLELKEGTSISIQSSSPIHSN